MNKNELSYSNEKTAKLDITKISEWSSLFRLAIQQQIIVGLIQIEPLIFNEYWIKSLVEQYFSCQKSSNKHGKLSIEVICTFICLVMSKLSFRLIDNFDIFLLFICLNYVNYSSLFKWSQMYFSCRRISYTFRKLSPL